MITLATMDASRKVVIMKSPDKAAGPPAGHSALVQITHERDSLKAAMDVLRTEVARIQAQLAEAQDPEKVILACYTRAAKPDTNAFVLCAEWFVCVDAAPGPSLLPHSCIGFV